VDRLKNNMDLLDVLKPLLLMETEENVQEQDLNVQEEEVLETSDELEEEEDSTDWKAKAEKADELANNYKIRAEKAERLAKSAKIEPVKKQPSKADGELSTKDIYALMEAKVAEQDIDKVQEIAKLKAISVSAALKLSLTKQILSDEIEQRSTASAANVGGSKRGSGKVPDDVLLANASKGNLPDNDADLERLIKLRKGIK